MRNQIYEKRSQIHEPWNQLHEKQNQIREPRKQIYEHESTFGKTKPNVGMQNHETSKPVCRQQSPTTGALYIKSK